VGLDSNGGYSLLLLTGDGSLNVEPTIGTPYEPYSEPLALTADLVRNLRLPQISFATVSGTVRGVGGQPLSGVSVRATTTSSFTAFTDAAGQYTLTVLPGTGTLTFQRSTINPAAPIFWRIEKYSVPLTGASTLDVNLEIVRINGVISDTNGVGVPNVSVSATTNGFDSLTQTQMSSNGSATSDPQGSYSFLVVAGSGSVFVSPGSSSGFSAVSISTVTLTQNLSQRVFLQRPDTTAPVIVTKPVVVHLSDTSVSVGWTTNEAATSRVEFGLGGLTSAVTSNTLTTSHSVTLLDLEAQGIYTFRVGSADRFGNGPAFSSAGFFKTQAPPGDITAPVITSGPAVVFVDQTKAVIQWSTDEPTNGAVDYGVNLGSTVGEPSGTFLKSHSVTISGLQPDTTYSARVGAVDPDGNSTSGSTFPFTTRSVPDTQPPVIVGGPTATAVGDTQITLAWKTDEAATTAVSYNDGSVFNVTSDDTFTTDHTITLAGLSPSRQYHITVSSKDPIGNGPTLAPVIHVTTMETPDTTPPTVTNLSVEVAKVSAVVRWTTSEPATAEARFGITAADPDSFQADLGLTVSHEITLTSLQPGTQYYGSAISVDAAGNPASSPFTLSTLAANVNVPPTAPGPFTVSPNPSRIGSFVITWGAATDDGPGGIVSYEIFRNGLSLALLAGNVTSYGESGLGEGQYTYTVRARDGENLTADSQAVSAVVDQTPPTIVQHSDISTPASSATDAIVTYSLPPVTDAFDASPVVSCVPVSGSAFPIGTTTVSCTAKDAAGNSSNGTFSVIVTDPFRPVLTVPRDLSVQTAKPDGESVTFVVSATDNADPNPSVECTPASGSVFPGGTTQVTCVASDVSGNTATATFNVTVTVTNVAPVAQNGSISTQEDVAVGGTLSASDPNGSSVVFSIVTNGAKGVVIVNPSTGAFSYTPGANLNGSDRFTYKVNDGTLDSNVATIDVSISPVNDAPVAAALTATTIKNAPVNGTLSATDVDADALSYAAGTVAAGHGTVAINPATGGFTYTPAQSYIGLDVFTYVVRDGAGASNEATVTVNIDSDTASGTIPPGGGTITSDSEGDGATSTDPVETAVTSPNGGSVTVTEQEIKGNAPVGYEFVGEQVLITAPDATQQNPLVLTFLVDGSVLDTPKYKHENENTVDIFRNRVLVPNCTDASGMAIPDPCVAVRQRLLPDAPNTPGDLRFVVLTSKASEWHLGVSTTNTAPVGAADSYTTAGVALTVGAPGVLANDRDADGQTLTATLVEQPQSGTVTLLEDGSFTYTADSSYTGPVTFTYRAFDGTDSASSTVTIAVAIHTSTSVISSPSTPVEGQPVTLTATVSSLNAAAGTPSGRVEFFNGSVSLGSAPLTGGRTSFTIDNLPSGNHAIMARYAGGGYFVESTGALPLTIVNATPSVGNISWTAFDGVKVGSAVTATAAFGDAGISDTHTATWNWGDGTSSSGTVTESHGSGSAAGTHAYTTAGLYVVTLTIADNDGAAGQSLFRYVAIYNPTAGYVTSGGAAIASPAGAYPAAPTLTGTATFTSLGARYVSGATTATGTTRFTLPGASLTLNSSAYKWLVVSGAKAWAKGSGTVTIGSGNYACQFVWSVVDGQVTGGGGTDRIRIKIWKTSDGSVVYDNTMGMAEEAAATQAVTTSNSSVMILK
jgi:VCBS repeat-containing protein